VTPVRDRRQPALDCVLLGLVVLVCGVVGVPEVVATLREGSVGLATVFYPVLLLAFAGLAWSRRTGS
jgi:hypothetical protein